MLRKAGYGLREAVEYFEHNPGVLKWMPSNQKTKCVVSYAKYGDEIRKEVQAGSRTVTGFFPSKGKQVIFNSYNGQIRTSFEYGYKVTTATSHNAQRANLPFIMEELTLNEPTCILEESKFYLHKNRGHAEAGRFINQGGEMRQTPLGGGFVNKNGIIWSERRTNGLDIEELDIIPESNPLNGVPNSSASVSRFDDGNLLQYYSSQNQYLGEQHNSYMSPSSVFKRLIDHIKNR